MVEWKLALVATTTARLGWLAWSWMGSGLESSVPGLETR